MHHSIFMHKECVPMDDECVCVELAEQWDCVIKAYSVLQLC